MICPNCGAKMEKHAFAHVCSYCSSMLQTEGSHNVSSSERDTADTYDYITRNISYLSAHPEFISLKQDRTSYTIKCAKEFHPLDNEYRLYSGIGMQWKAIISREEIQLTLIIKGQKSLNHSLVFGLDDSTFILLHGNQQDEYAVSYTDFEAICNSERIVLALNEIYKYDELRTYTHRFYNLVFDRTKYLYSINQKLLTDYIIIIMSKLVERREDKFHNKLELVTQEVTLWSASKLYDKGLSWQRNDIKARFRYWSTPEGESFLLDVDYGGPEWMFLREGDIVIRINDTKNIELKPSGEESDVHANEGDKIICREVLFYTINQEDFKDICNAKSLEFQITGSRSFVNGNAETLQAIARALYNSLYEPKFNNENMEEQLRLQKNTGWCMFISIPVGIVSGYLSTPFIYDGSCRGEMDWGFFLSGIGMILFFYIINYILPYPSKKKKIAYFVHLIFLVLSLLLGLILGY